MTRHRRIVRAAACGFASCSSFSSSCGGRSSRKGAAASDSDGLTVLEKKVGMTGRSDGGGTLSVRCGDTVGLPPPATGCEDNRIRRYEKLTD